MAEAKNYPRVLQVIDSVEVVGGAERLVTSLHSVASRFGWHSSIAPPLRIGRFRHRADVVHAHLLKSALLVAVFRGPGRSPKTVLTHHYADYYEFFNRSFLATLDRWSTKRYDRVVSVSQHGFAYLERSPRVSCILNGWDGEPSRSERGGLVACISHLRPEKGIDVLLRAGRKLQETGVRIRIAGDGPQRARLEKEADDLGIGGQVEFLGYLMNPFSLLSQAAILVVPSHFEALGIAALEGMAAGVPVIASRVGGLPELIKPGVNGELFTPGDHVELAGHIRRLLGDDDLRQRMGQAGREMAQQYTMEKTVTQYYELYEGLLAGRR